MEMQQLQIDNAVASQVGPCRDQPREELRDTPLTYVLFLQHPTYIWHLGK